MSAGDPRFLQAIAARLDESCDPPHVSAHDALDQSLLPVNYYEYSHLGESRSGEGLASPADSRGLAFHDAPGPLRGVRGFLIRRTERSLLDTTPRNQLPDTSVARSDQTSPRLFSASREPAEPDQDRFAAEIRENPNRSRPKVPSTVGHSTYRSPDRRCRLTKA